MRKILRHPIFHTTPPVLLDCQLSFVLTSAVLQISIRRIWTDRDVDKILIQHGSVLCNQRKVVAFFAQSILKSSSSQWPHLKSCDTHHRPDFGGAWSDLLLHFTSSKKSFDSLLGKWSPPRLSNVFLPRTLVLGKPGVYGRLALYGRVSQCGMGL